MSIKLIALDVDGTLLDSRRPRRTGESELYCPQAGCSLNAGSCWSVFP